ncbi:hypothetical protein TREAZ_0003 [Leadbettera azotonutricia ZAS-9]|uniref:Uncharacterized protein n=1 Tax=Leadbettera azotonutricia (strain ATCC BAA-888 / DSM 13862 / ZAS-9) TaxID=545695 RepID=F5YG73_LEAAZ|nr:hypothetical protein TREAZ_0003 [Leadbettera azotonutricia ZAS-9]
MIKYYYRRSFIIMMLIIRSLATELIFAVNYSEYNGGKNQP